MVSNASPERKWCDCNRLDAAVEEFDHAVGLGMRRRGEAVLDAEVGAKLIKRVLAGGAAFAQTEQPIGEFAAIIGQHRADADRAGAFQVAQKSAGVGGGFGFIDMDEHPAGRPVNRHEDSSAI